MLSTSQPLAAPLRLAALRHYVGMSQPDLAEAANLSVRSIRYIERGRTPQLESQMRIAAALNRRLRLMGEDSPIYPHALRHVDLWPLPDGPIA